MKTPEEIKNGLERCKDDHCICDECEFSDGNVKKWRSLMGDALAYIEQLEERTSLNTLRDAIYEDAVKHGLWEEKENLALKDFVNFIQDEVFMLDWVVSYFGNNVCNDNSAFCNEMADVIIAVLIVAGKLGIDIDAAVRRKMEINKGRPWKHGKDEKK